MTDQTTKKKPGRGSLDRNAGGRQWTVRRRIIVLSLLFCAGLVLYITYKGIDSRTAETIIQSAFALAGAVIGAYCFSATWQDRGSMDVLVNNGLLNNVEEDSNNSNTTNGTPPTNSSSASTPVDNPDK